MLNVKLTDEEQAEFGIEKPESAVALLRDGKAAAELLAEAQAREADMENTIKALTARVDALEAATKDLNAAAFPAEMEDAIVSRAIEASTKSVMALVAKIGGQALPSGNAPADVTNSEGSLPEDPIERWKASKELRAEFSTAERYAAYCKAMENNAVRIFVPKNAAKN
jgi:hypothetical protein